MNSLDLKTVKNAINICGKHMAGRRLELTFSNNQKLSFFINRSVVLSMLGFEKNINNKPTDKDIMIMYDNLNKMERKNVLEVSEAIIDMLSNGRIDDLAKFVMLIYNEFQNKLELIVTTDFNHYYSLIIDNKQRLEKIKKVDDVFLTVEGNRFVIPISFLSIAKGRKILVDQKLSKKQIKKVRAAATSIATNCDANFTDKFLKLRYVDSLTHKDKSYMYKKKKTK